MAIKTFSKFIKIFFGNFYLSINICSALEFYASVLDIHTDTIASWYKNDYIWICINCKRWKASNQYRVILLAFRAFRWEILTRHRFSFSLDDYSLIHSVYYLALALNHSSENITVQNFQTYKKWKHLLYIIYSL